MDLNKRKKFYSKKGGQLPDEFVSFFVSLFNFLEKQGNISD